MLKHIGKFSLFFLSAFGCISEENQVDGNVIKDKILNLDTNVIEKYGNNVSNSINLVKSHEVLSFANKSILKTDLDEFFLLSDINTKDGKSSFHIHRIDTKSCNFTPNFFCEIKGKLFTGGIDKGEIKICECELEDSLEDAEQTNISVKKLKIINTEGVKNEPIGKVKEKTALQCVQRQIEGCQEIQGPTIFQLDTVTAVCSNCVAKGEMGRRLGCLILVRSSFMYEERDFTREIPVNLVFFFDGKTIEPCVEYQTDNSFRDGTLNDFIVSAMKAAGDKIMCQSKRSIINSDKTGEEKQSMISTDYINLVDLFININGQISYKLISTYAVNNLKDFTFLQTKDCTIPTIINENNGSIQIGKLTKKDFFYQPNVQCTGIDWFTCNAQIDHRTKLREYHMCFVNNDNILLQNDKSQYAYLITLNKMKQQVLFS